MKTKLTVIVIAIGLVLPGGAQNSKPAKDDTTQTLIALENQARINKASSRR